jgi:hypothetical protein
MSPRRFCPHRKEQKVPTAYGRKRVRRLWQLRLAILAFALWCGATGRAADQLYECEIKDHLQLTDEGYRNDADSNIWRSRPMIIDKFSGAVVASIFYSSMEWKRIRMASQYATFHTQGYDPGGKPVVDVFVQEILDERGNKWKGSKTQFVVINQPDLGIFHRNLPVTRCCPYRVL